MNKFIFGAVVVLVIAVGFFGGIELNKKYLRGPLAPPFKLAVVGGGLGGASVSVYTGAYFARTGCGRTPHFDIFEKTDRWGGRLISYYFQGAKYNPMQLGGNWFPNTSLTIQQLLKIINLNMVEAEYDNAHTRIWNGETFEPAIPQTDPNYIHLDDAHQFFNQQIVQIYLWLAFNQQIFTSVDGFLNPSGQPGFGGAPFPFVNYKDFLSQYQISTQFLEHFVVPNLRFIWSQSFEINSFSGFIGDVLMDNHYRVDGGSTNVVSVLLNKIKPVSNQYLNTAVTDITKLKNGQFEVKYRTTKNDGQAEEKTGIYDGVALTTPVEFSNINFHGFDNFPKKAREWLALHMYLVDAESMNPLYFGLPENEKVPDSIRTTDGVNFTSIFPTSPTNHGTNVYMIFSYVELDIENLFKGIVPYTEQERWVHHFYPYVYQKLVPKSDASDFQPYEVAPNFIYLNAMEDFVSGMELCLISSNNAGKYFADRNARPVLGKLTQ